jgi:3-oxoacyl-[acyl-carrier protein] reductase
MKTPTVAQEIAFVTGGASGIGRATTLRLAQDGFLVVPIDRNAKAIDLLLNELKDSGFAAMGHVADVCDRASIARILDTHARVDVMVCAAGVGPTCSFDDITDDAFRAVLEVNLIGVFIAAQEAVRRMKSGGRVVTISSRAALGGTGFAHYVASKAGVVGLTRAMAMDLRARRIASTRSHPVSPTPP